MDQEASVILSNIDETRQSISEKLELLEGHVKESVQTAKKRVEHTMEAIENVQSTVKDTVSSVKENLNIKKHVVNHPWPMMGASVLAGVIVGKWVSANNGGGAPAPAPIFQSGQQAPQDSSARSQPLQPPVAPAPTRSSTFLRWFSETFNDEIQTAKGMLVKAVLEKVKNVAQREFPEASEKFQKLADSAESKFRQ